MNLKEFSIITVRERLSHSSRNLAELDIHDTDTDLETQFKKRHRIYGDDFTTSDQQTEEPNTRVIKALNHGKRIRRNSSGKCHYFAKYKCYRIKSNI